MGWQSVQEAPLTSPLRQNGAKTYLRYLLLIFALPALGYLLVFPLVRFPQLGFDRWGGSKWAPVLDYSYHATQADADIVIFGDSSAFLGVDPRWIDRKLGTHTVVLPNTVGSLEVTGVWPCAATWRQTGHRGRLCSSLLLGI